MKLKVRPEDFVVEELTSIPLKHHGPYTLVKLTKRYWNTLDAINYIARELSVPRRNLARAGLKDRYSLSTQYLTIKGQWHQTFKTENLSMIPVGHTQRPMSPFFLHGNRFMIILRDCTAQEVSCIEHNAPHVRMHGIVNYFDEQRFGSARHKKGFFARELARSHLQGALKLLLCYPYKEDGKQERQFKRYCHEHWGQWRDCFRIAPARYRKLISALIEKPRGYKDAIKTIDRELLNLYLLAYQSHLFNEVIREYIETLTDDPVRIPYNLGTFAFFRDRPPEQCTPDRMIPLLNEKSRYSGHLGSIIQSVLDREGITPKDFTLRKMRFRGVRFKPSQRPIMVVPRALTITDPDTDELYPRRKKISIRFDLPAGSYATLVLKRLLAS
jgi:tRNA pseudouridine13 synthase